MQKMMNQAKPLYIIGALFAALSSCAAVPSKDVQTTTAVEPLSQAQLKENIPVVRYEGLDSLPNTEPIPPSDGSVPLEVIPAPESFIPVDPAPSIETADARTYPFIRMVNSGQKNNFGNPIYDILLYNNGQVVKKVQGVTGRAHTQNRDRNTSGNEAPLPNGRYLVSTSWIGGTHPEVGGRFLPITPLFRTNRTALGFHVDPSYNKSKQEDGTAGCIGLINIQDRDALFNFASQYKPRYLDVQI